MRRARDWLAPAPVVAVAVVAFLVARASGVKAGPAFAALPDVLRAAAATLALFAVSGYALAERLTPEPLRPFRHLLMLPVGAMTSCLALTALGFAHVPLTASLAIVLAGGAVASLVVARRPAPVDPAVGAYVALGALLAALVLVPSFRASFATVPGLNPDAQLVSGLAVLFQHAPPQGTRLGLPVPELPDVWRSKVPIFYGLAAVSRLSGLAPVAAFPTVAALLVGLVAAGFGLVGRVVLGLRSGWAVVVMAAVGLDVALLHVAVHPYWNQLWGLMSFPFALLFAWLAVAERDWRALALFGLALLLGAFAYPLMLPYPLVALAAFALAERRLPALPRRGRSPWALVAVLAVVAFAAPLLGVWEKVSSGVDNLVGGGGSLWHGDLSDFYGAGWFVGVGDGWAAAGAVAAVAVLALVVAVPRRRAAALGALLALCALADLRLRLADDGAYFDFKHLAFTGPLVLTVAVAGVAWLAARRRALAGLALAALAAYAVVAARQVADELHGTYEQVTRQMLALHRWSGTIADDRSLRLDIAPSGFQLWAAYFLARHPLDSPQPIEFTTYPHVAPGYRADYAVSLAPRLERQLAASGSPPPPAPGRLGPVVFANSQYVVRRVLSAPGPATASRARF
jgi:hypothetical protein